MITYPMSATALYAASEYYKLKPLLDAYPKRLEPLVTKIKNSIDKATYEYLTNKDCDALPINFSIESIVGGHTKVVEFKDVRDYVIKTSRVGLLFDLLQKKMNIP